MFQCYVIVMFMWSKSYFEFYLLLFSISEKAIEIFLLSEAGEENLSKAKSACVPTL